MTDGEVLQCKLITETKKGSRIKSAATLRFYDGRIEFLKSPFSLKDEIKAMAGSKWHGFEDPPRKIWSVEDCPRNRFQLGYLMGEEVYAWFDRELQTFKYERPLMPHQCDLSNHALTYHYGLWGAEMGTGKTLAAIEVMEKSGITEWFYCGPKAALKAIEREFKKWKIDPRVTVTLLTYDALVTMMDNWPSDKKPPMGVVFDESSRLKTATSQRSRAAQKLADLIRKYFGYDGYVLLMSGTPSPKTPVDWWAQAEIAWPGFLKEGSPKSLEQRLAFMVDEQYDSGAFKKRAGWKDNELKCDTCGKFATDAAHDDMLTEPEDYHAFQPSKNEVALMHDRLKGLVVVKHKKDCLTLPDKRYRTILCKPNKSTLRVAQALMESAPNAMTGLTLLRELSDGFQYREEADGKTACGHCTATGEVQEWFDPTDEERTFSAVDMLRAEVVAALEKRTICCPVCGGDKEVNKYIRTVREIPCPKETALIQLLEEVEENGRIVVAAGFTGSVDRCVNICLKKKWDVVRCDGRGFVVFKTHSDGTIEQLIGVDALDYWADRNNSSVAFVMHPESGGMGLTLVEARMMVFWSNSFKPEYRIQAEDRIHRKGMDENLGCEIVDLIHLPTDQRVVDVIRENRNLELMTMGAFVEVLKDESIAGDGELVEIAI
jgi:hypothetical protein